MDIHGKWQVAALPHQIVVSRIKGSFSERAIYKYCEQIKIEVLKFKGLPWIHICDAREFGLAVPEATNVAEQANKWAEANNRIQRIFYTNTSMQQYQLKKVPASRTETMYMESLEDIILFLDKNQLKHDKESILQWFKHAELN